MRLKFAGTGVPILAMPGRIIQALKQASTRNPVVLLDEIEKMTRNYMGDPTAAMLEVLDPDQNEHFTDHYLDTPFSLQEVFFVATANSLDHVPRPLLDRLEVIRLSGYTEEEKVNIAEQHVIPKTIEEHGLTGQAVETCRSIDSQSHSRVHSRSWRA